MGVRAPEGVVELAEDLGAGGGCECIYLRELGMVLRAKQRWERGFDGQSRGFIVGGNLELKKPMIPDIEGGRRGASTSLALSNDEHIQCKRHHSEEVCPSHGTQQKVNVERTFLCAGQLGQ